MEQVERFSDDFVPAERRTLERRGVLRGFLVAGVAAVAGPALLFRMRTAYAWDPPDEWHTDTTVGHTDTSTPHTDHADGHADSPHSDIGHTDNVTHGDHLDGGTYSDAPGHMDQSPGHVDSPHGDNAHWDGGVYHQDGAHMDTAHGDSVHADTPHDDSTNHTDGGAPNSHSDHSDGANHIDQHTDGGHADHSDLDETPYSDVPAHSDFTPGRHTDTHYDHWDHQDDIHGDH